MTGLLARVAGWRLTADAWHEVGVALAVLDTALDAGDPDGLLDAAAEVELAGPMRGAPDLVTDRPAPAPQPIPPLVAATVERIGVKLRVLRGGR